MMLSAGLTDGVFRKYLNYDVEHRSPTVCSSEKLKHRLPSTRELQERVRSGQTSGSNGSGLSSAVSHEV